MSIKQRIIGGVILLAFLAFCVHMLLKSHLQDTRPQTQIAKINLNPPVPSSALPEATPTLTAPIDEAITKIKQVQEKSVQAKAQIMTVTQDLQKNLQKPPLESSLNVPTSPNVSNKPTENQLKKTQIQTQVQTQVQTKTQNIKPDLHHPKIHGHNSKATGLVIQVGVFGVPANAKNLIKTLQKNGFSAYSNKIHTQNGQMTRVLVQTKTADRAKAKTIVLKINALTQLSGIILS